MTPTPEEILERLAAEPDTFKKGDGKLLLVGNEALEVLTAVHFRTGESMESLKSAVYKQWVKSQSMQAGSKKSSQPENQRKQNLFQFAKMLVSEHYFKTVAGKKSDKIYRYSVGRYFPDGEVFIKSKCQQLLDENVIGNHSVSEIIGHVKRLTYCHPAEPPPELLPVKNGIVQLTTGSLLEHSPEYFFTFQLPVAYREEAQCPKITDFLSQILTDGDILLLQEYVGFCFYRRYFLKKALLVIGDRNTGKTTLLSLLQIFFQTENVSGLSIQRVSTDRFAAAYLHRKLANVCDELPYADIANAANFKVAVGGGYLSAEEKFGDNFQFLNHAKFIFAANQIPRFKDSGDMAYYDRWILMWFQAVIPPAQQNPFLLDSITTAPELEGFLKWGLRGIQRLLKNQCFTYSLTAEQNRAMMLANSEPLHQFIQVCILQSDGAAVPKDDLYALYRYHAAKNGFPVGSKTMLTRQLLRLAPFIATGQRRIDGKVCECYLNLTLPTERQDIKDFFKNYMKNQKKGENSTILIDTYNAPKTPETPDNPIEGSESLLTYVKAQRERPVALEKVQRACADGFDLKPLVDKLVQDGVVYEPRAGFLEVVS